MSLFLEGKWQHVKDTTSIGEGKMFSPGNLRATSDNANYAKVLVSTFCSFFSCLDDRNLYSDTYTFQPNAADRLLCS